MNICLSLIVPALVDTLSIVGRRTVGYIGGVYFPQGIAWVALSSTIDRALLSQKSLLPL
jgi:hypothetical protein